MQSMDIIQITADNTDVLNGRMEMPSWTKTVRIQLVAPDSDWLFDAHIANHELARASGPHRTGADNLQNFDWLAPHLEQRIHPADQNRDILIDVNVVTGGVGMLAVGYFS